MRSGRRRSPTGRLLAAAVAVSVVAGVPAVARASSAPSARAAASTRPVYLDTHYTFAERAADLVSRMTPAEKTAQLQTNNAPAIPRLGVQQYTYWSEGQHGINRLGADTAAGSQGELDVTATSFPVNFASTMSWDPELTYQETTAISDEVRGFLDKSLWGKGQNNIGPSASDYGDLTFWAPTVNMDRDPRWGRTNESFGEDTYLASTMAGAFVNGYQGQTITGRQMTPYLKVAATAKHYALNNDENSRHTQSANTTDANTRDYYTKQFAALVQNAHVSGVMTSYNAVNGTPAPADTYTVNELLQATYGFGGYTTSDCGAIGDVYSSGGHNWAPPGWTTNGTTWTNTATGKQVPAAAGGQAFALRAGTQLNCAGGELTAQNIDAAITMGILTPGVIDSALAKLFTVRMQTGEFDPAGKVAYTKITKAQIESPPHQALAEKVAAQDLVLLQNNEVTGTSTPLLPADPAKLDNIVVVGNLANTTTLGGYSGRPTLTVNAVQGITAAAKAANPSATVTFDACGTTTTATAPAECSAATQAAVKTADLVVVAVGSDMGVADEGTDRSALSLPGNYDSLISQVAALGNPRTALVMQADGPYDIQEARKDFPAIVFSGYNGESQGAALAQVLFGEQNPSGHLDFTWYADDSQLPAMDDYGLTPSETGGLGRTYMHFTGKPTYPFGYGLSYSRFTYSGVHVGPGSVSADGTVNVGFDVTNTGTVAGSTVAQLYAAPQFTVPGVELPKEQLAGFKKTAVLAPGRTQHVSLSVKAADLSHWDEDSLKQVVHNGAYQFRVGPDSATVAGSGTVRVHGAITPRVQSVTVQPAQVVFTPGDSLDLTGTNPWIAPDTDPTLEQKHAPADHIVEAAMSDQSLADLSRAHVTYRSSDPRVATVASTGVVTMRAPGAATIEATVNGVTGTTPIVVQNPFSLRAAGIVKPNTTITATATFANTSGQAVRGLTLDLTSPSGWTATPTSPVSLPEVAPGQTVTATWSVGIPGSASPGTKAELDATAAFTGRAGAYSEAAVSALTVTSGATPEQVTPVVTGTNPPAGSLKVVVNNPSDTPTTVTAVDWKLGSASGTQPVSATIAPQGSATVDVPVTGISFAEPYTFTVTSVISGDLSSEPFSGHATFLPVANKSLGDSWTLADVQDGPAVDLATTADGTWSTLDGSQPYGGASDLSGKVWLDWDSTNLYLTANLTDDVFSEPATGADIWQGDCLQFAATSGVPGSSAASSTASVNGHYEYGAALTSAGAQLYRWIAPTEGSGQVTNATVHVTRDEAAHTTLYQLAIPWSDLTSVQPAANTVFSFALDVNDKDNGVRKGYMQWGDGIGSSKDVSGFDMAQLMPAGA
ncbi:glycoside hydrolase family 3 C-terminal domain-containing protein [Streptomyces cocklensis]|uniref:Beta-glucosidase n=1 Tax=Actinacidiphila cocklensis TaxID=887465 RepID=A0A9W4DNJ6_9ACTN|nr:glycoside hydrolase family 3 C-terminal domain-containing protein [Actinacidiphila cocklensis]MDD1059594.1 glycoside hydrolase family 3 C-terminal domain-containing protein [Actinacidiphila cocklensis]CAG6392868.1 Beta-glucosidase [Actinacidiphila cocklensis]